MATSLPNKVLDQLKQSQNKSVNLSKYVVLGYERKKESCQTPGSVKASGSQEYWSSLS